MQGLKYFRCSVCGVVIVQGETETEHAFAWRVWVTHLQEHKEANDWPGWGVDLQRSWKGMFHPLALVSGDRVHVAVAA